MNSLPHYTTTGEIHSGAETVIYRGYRNVDRASVAIKLFRSEYPTSRQIAKLRHEYAITKDLDVSGVVRAYGLERVGAGLALVTENIDAHPLSDILQTQALSLKTSLRIADSIADAMDAIHRRHIIHKDIKPHNILVHPETLQVKLIDFGIATRLSQEIQQARSPDSLEGTLPYMSPEQTGRMNRALDHRTDLYSLGVTLYEMLTGVLPFRATDPLELLHSHIAREPTPPHERRPEVPEVVSDIVMKLLSKAAEDRYQSAHGLRADLRECLEQLEATGQITPFPLGRYDRGHGLLIPQKLYGRDAEIAALLAAWDRASRGAAELALISGHAGIGKSAVVSELHKVIADPRARFIAGKFDQFNRSVPYASLAQAFRDLIRHLLTEHSEPLTRLRRKLATALGQSGQVLVDLMPELELIIGPQPPVPELGATESQNRLNLVFQSFLGVFATPDHPLVLFLDDLQWADLASLRLLTLLLSDPERGHLLVIGAYRDNEVDAGHPLRAALAELRSAGTSMVELPLAPLRLSDASQLVADALGCDQQRSASLAKLVLDKTQGNPFFINQFLVALYKDHLLTFDPSSGSYWWDLERIRRAGITDNVVDFMARKLRRLTPSTQRILTLAACIGHKFDLETLAMIYERPLADTAADLWEALREGIVLPLDTTYRFVHAVHATPDQSGGGEPPPEGLNVSYRFLHDRVQQAAYLLVEEDHKQDLHLRIGRLLLSQRGLGEREENLFDTVNHLNLGAARITSASERTSLARLNLAAGTKAKASAAYDVAASYLGAGMSLLDEQGWEQAYELTYALHIERAGCEFLSGRFAQAESLFNFTLTRARTNLDRADVYGRRLLLFNTVAKFDEAVRCARTALALLGVELPDGEDRIQAALAAELAEVPYNLAGRRITDLFDAPALTHPEYRAALTILTNVSAAMLGASPSLHALVCVKHANISLKYGHSEVSAWGYLIYAIVLMELGRYDEGYEFGRLAMELDERLSCAVVSSKVKSSFAVFISPYREPLRTSFSYLSQAHRDGLEVGDFQFASYSLFHGVTNRLSHGVELAAISEEIERSIPFLQRTKDVMSNLIVTSSKQVIANLRGCTQGHHTLSDGVFDEAEFSATVGAPNHEFMAVFYHIQRAQLAYLYEDHARALALIALAEPLRPYLACMWMTTEVPFYASLIMLALYPTATAADRARYDREIERHAADVAAWAGSCPENFLHKRLLIAAERARVSGDDAAATDLYEQAIKAAQDSEYLHHEALANELAARFHLAKGRTKIARMYMDDAVYGYTRWGAEAKVAQLNEKYAELAPRRAEPQETRRPARTTMITGLREDLDLATIVKASQAISGEIELGKLLERLLRTAMENAGANKGYLLLARDEDLYVEAAADADGPLRSVLQSVPLDQVEDLSQAVVRYVQKTEVQLVLGNAAHESTFSSDPYVARSRPKSVLCAPILQQGKLVGVLYLENTLLEDAFTPARLEILQMLSAQAAISIENSRLYGTLEDKVRERTAELQEAQAKLIRLEREATEKRMAGGFAHEIRNALSEAKLVLARVLGEDETSSRTSLTFDSGMELGMLHEELSLRFADEELDRITARLQHIFENQEELDAALRLVSKATARALAITGKIMDFSRIGEGERPAERINVNELIDGALAELRQTIPGSSIAIRAEVAGSIHLVADPTQCYSVVQNLLNNARDAVVDRYPRGGAGAIGIRARVEGEACVIQVADNGSGIRPENMGKIFDSFYSTKPETGAGLGLAVVKRIIDVAGGTIEVQSEWGKGSQFTVTLPLSRPPGARC
ncbi:trifunctional serine/threonine-protein kinase/ATP-binding protein/sensor histidine kinase [Sorangium sp. So ce131]|uniref:trifunctional serine/threonine-protein kinase/ATP-binding protein/sensor histidine kinase n=1 Tax=Sorangium sp. So ce131 TaxID=3133282 RepID=UPI003F60813F